MKKLGKNITLTLGDKLKFLRKNAALSQKDAAKMIGVTPSYLNQIENDKIQVPNLKVLNKLAVLYSYSYIDLLKLAGTPLYGSEEEKIVEVSSQSDELTKEIERFLNDTMISLKKLDLDVNLIDAIAENLSLSQTLEILRKTSSDYIISIIGFECFQEDMITVNKIKDAFPNSKLIIIGYYPTLFPKEIFKNSKADMIIRGEPDLTIYELFKKIKNNEDFSSLNGIAFRKKNQIKIKENYNHVNLQFENKKHLFLKSSLQSLTLFVI